MNKQQLIEILSATLSKNRVAELVLQAGSGDASFDIPALYQLCFHPQPEIAFRASWVLESLALQEPIRFSEVVDDFLQDFPKQHNRSCQRCFTKTLMAMQDRKAPKPYLEALARADRDTLVTVVFEWLIDPETPVAVSANCIDILYNFSREYDWVPHELALQIELLIERGDSPALFSRGKRVLKKLRLE